MIGSKKKDTEVVYKDRIVKVEADVNVDTPTEVKVLDNIGVNGNYLSSEGLKGIQKS